MSENKYKACYKNLLDKLSSLEDNLDELHTCISKLKENYTEAEEIVEDEEVCPDEVAADKAAYEAIREICLESLLDVEPQGDA